MKILAIGVAVFYLFGLKLSSEIKAPAKQTEQTTIKANPVNTPEVQPRELIDTEKSHKPAVPRDSSLISTESAIKNTRKGA